MSKRSLSGLLFAFFAPAGRGVQAAPGRAARLLPAVLSLSLGGFGVLVAPGPAAALKPLPKKGAAAAAKKGPPAPPPDGTLLSSSREVTVRADAGTEWKEAEMGQALGRRDRVRSGKGGTATLDAAGGRLWLDPATQIVVLGEKVKKGKAGVELVEGSLRAAVDTSGPAGKARVLRVQAGDAEVRIRGTARVQVGPAPGDLQVAVYQGTAEVAGKKGPPAKLSAGAGLALRRGAKPKVGGLIGAPAWEGEAGLFFAVPQRGGVSAAELQLPFKAVPGAARYRVEVGRDEALTDRVYVGTVPADAKLASARVTGKGRYFVRLQAVDSDQVTGPGPVQPVVVAEVRGDRLVATLAPAAPGKAHPVLLAGAGELAFDLVPAGAAGTGKLQVQLDGKAVPSEGGAVAMRVGRGLHQVQVIGEGGQKGELRVEVSRPSYAVEIGQDAPAAGPRAYRVEIRALDSVGQGASGGPPVQVRAAPVEAGADKDKAPEGQAMALSMKAAGVYVGQVEVAPGQLLRLSVRDGDGPVATADLPGAGVE